MYSGGGSREVEATLDARTLLATDALRRLGQIVNKPGIIPYQGNQSGSAYLCTCAGAKQADAAAQAGTSTKSIQKCKPLVESVIGACAAGVALAGTTALVGPTAEASLVVLLVLQLWCSRCV
jgi:hypothetical protein